MQPRSYDSRSDVSVSPERLLAFGDAVFAIAITLLALDITVPEGLPGGEVAGALRDALPKVEAYLLSFLVIGVMWMGHHALFRAVVRLDRTLLHLYLLMLAVVAALPFPTRLISEYGQTPVATGLYGAVIAVTVLLLALMATRVSRHPGLLSDDADPAQTRRLQWQHGALAAVFATSIPVAIFASSTAAQYWWLLALPVRMVIRNRRTGKATAPAMAPTSD